MNRLLWQCISHVEHSTVKNWVNMEIKMNKRNVGASEKIKDKLDNNWENLDQDQIQVDWLYTEGYVLNGWCEVKQKVTLWYELGLIIDASGGKWDHGVIYMALERNVWLLFEPEVTVDISLNSPSQTACARISENALTIRHDPRTLNSCDFFTKKELINSSKKLVNNEMFCTSGGKFKQDFIQVSIFKLDHKHYCHDTYWIVNSPIIFQRFRGSKVGESAEVNDTIQNVTS